MLKEAFSVSGWLLKTEPDEYSWADLIRESEAVWDGIKAAPAIKNLKQMQPGDPVYIYHTGKERRIVGTAEVTSFPYVSPAGDETLIRIAARQELPQAVTLTNIKNSGLFSDWDLVRLPRLSVVPVSESQWEWVMEMGTMEARKP